MNCEKCQEILSDFLDDAMSDADRATFNAHLEECLPCFNVHAELNSIVSYCRDHRGEYDAPPNETALWLRIRNTIESAPLASAAQKTTRQVRRESWWSRMVGRSWELSLPQMATAVVAIIVFASLATVFGLRSLQSNPSTASTTLNSSGGQSVALTGNPNSGVPKVFEPKDRLWQQQQINYLTQVVAQRKAHWNPQVRADFERNLDLLDETVSESLEKLSTHPHDDVMEEMLNSALNDKVQLLQEFSDL